jgi:hypothetical protein
VATVGAAIAGNSCVGPRGCGGLGVYFAAVEATGAPRRGSWDVVPQFWTGGWPVPELGGVGGIQKQRSSSQQQGRRAWLGGIGTKS